MSWALLALVPLAVLLFLSLQRRSTLLGTMLRDWAIAQVAEASDSVYQLSIGRAHLSLLGGRIVIDSMRLVTDTSRNDFRAHPLPVITATATGCRVLGIDTWQLLVARGVIARLFRCDAIDAAVLETVRDTVSAHPAAATAPAAMSFVRDSIMLPALLPIIVVHSTEMPRLSLDYTRRARGGATTHVTLQRLNIQLRETRIDPAVRPGKRKPLFSEQALVTADLLTLGGAKQAVVLGRVRGNLTDSTLALDAIVLGPPASDADWVKAQGQRSDLIRFHLDSARFKGVDYRRLGSAEGAIVVRHAQLHGFRLDVLSDKRLPAGPPHKRRTPQQWVASLDRPLALDTVIVVGGKIAYSEHAVGHARVGTMTWEQIQAQVTDVRTVARAGSVTPPMLVLASALLQGQGKLDVNIEIPLTAAQFDMKYSGSLGPISMLAFNSYAEQVMPVRATSGAMQSIRFAVVVRHGRSTGQIVPLYSDFKVALEDKKGGFLKKAGLSVVSFFANSFKIRGNNPGKPGEAPVVGRINQAYAPTASLPQVLWLALKEGLGKVFLK